MFGVMKQDKRMSSHKNCFYESTNWIDPKSVNKSVPSKQEVGMSFLIVKYPEAK